MVLPLSPAKQLVNVSTVVNPVKESELNMARKHKGLRSHAGGTDKPGMDQGQGSGEKHFSSRQLTTGKGRGKRHGTHRGSSR